MRKKKWMDNHNTIRMISNAIAGVVSEIVLDHFKEIISNDDSLTYYQYKSGAAHGLLDNLFYRGHEVVKNIEERLNRTNIRELMENLK